MVTPILGRTALGGKTSLPSGVTSLIGASANVIAEKEEMINELMRINEGNKHAGELSEQSEKVCTQLIS